MTIRTRSLAAATATLSALTMVSACAVTQKADSATTTGETQIAFLTASSANTWLTASLKAMNEDAAKQNVKITVFDAKFQPGTASKQIEDVIAAKKYKGIVLATVDGSAAIPAVQDALDAGLKVVVLNQVVGTKLDTADPQVAGISASVLAPPQATGERLGKLTVKACAETKPCDVVYMYGTKGTPFDDAVRKGFDAQIAGDGAIKVVADAEGGFLGTDQPRKATQDVIQAHPSFDVLVGSGDQQIRGALLALTDAGKTKVKVIGVGGSEPAIAGVKDGTWWGDVAGAPVTEGHAAFAAMMDAVKNGKDEGGVDVTDQLVDNGLITKANVDKFTAQWPG
ncbi:putative ABC-type sugar transport system periplasmic component-like protein [Nostocoides japonicum T1-X7]|uniref:Putative ABC-type sugar transport system periplasmic component-like protein n=1 Tax=Nostocoides japonicum T1-X7 TaxID=1194083 RepID=A0A077LX55_9MICO|nr:sugar ABC transporter substrate-binding protein [Tetrasphaera japonica]CCH77472.1 putative ABC-type sugar transport system periplasmic component-like protein [Tetrasphaera japonica T1-X7]